MREMSGAADRSTRRSSAPSSLEASPAPPELSGVTGYGAHGGVHRKGLIGAPHDKPVALLVIENETKLRAALPILRPMVAEGVFVMFDAELIPLP